MVERLLEWGLVDQAEYLGIDTQARNIHTAYTRLPTWGRKHGLQVQADANIIDMSRENLHWRIQFQEADIKSFGSQGTFDLQIVQATLDLIDVPTALPNLARLLSPNGLFYYTLNFDGATIFEPVTDQTREDQIIESYHLSMDDRLVQGEPSGDSRTGRHLFNHLKTFGANILAAGASDWVVFPGPLGYPAEEAYFLHCIINFFENTLREHPDVDQEVLTDWIAERHSQIECCELIYIAHQLDFLGKFYNER